ncbi:MAG: helix-turn-helix transcriptional regulator [Pseudomonadota bacterium]
MISEALRLLRVFHDLKQRELAAKLGISTSHVSELEKGNRTPSLEVIQKYAAVFRIPVSSIMFFSESISDAQSGSRASGNAKSAIASKVISFLQLIESKADLDGAT